MKSKLAASVLSLSLLVPGLTTVFQAPAQAFCVDIWNDDCDLIPDEVLPEIDDVVDQHTIVLVNNTPNTMYFNLDGAPYKLAAGYQLEESGVGSFSIEFDGSFRSGYQGESYNLSSGNYTFENVNYGIELYSK